MSFTTGVLVDVCYFNIPFQILLGSDFSFFRNQIGPTPDFVFFFFFVNKDSLKHSHAHYTLAVTCYDGRVRQFKHKAYVVTVQHCTEKNLLNSDLKQGGIEMHVPYFVNDHCCIT